MKCQKHAVVMVTELPYGARCSRFLLVQAHIGLTDADRIVVIEGADEPDLVSLAEARDLSQDPYRVLLRKSDGYDDVFTVEVDALDVLGQIVAQGTLPDGISFVEGRLLERTISLVEISP